MIERSKLRAAAARPAAKEPESPQVQAQQAEFDEQMEERAELMREANALRDIMLAQLKADDEALKKYIAMI
jgi:hypothetical protein